MGDIIARGIASQKPKSLRILSKVNLSYCYELIDTDGTLYISQYAKLYSSTNYGDTKTLVHDFGTGTLITLSKLLASGTMLVQLNDGDGTYSLYRSTDKGANWTMVLDPCPFILNQGWCEDASGSIYIMSYNNSPSALWGQIYRSDNDGATWTLIKSITGIKHIHFIAEDPYNPGTLYIGTGDLDAECFWYTSTDKCATLTQIGTGSQRYRTVSMLFTPNYIVWGMDSTDLAQPPYLMRRNRITSVDEYVQRVNAPIYFSHKTAKGELLIGSCPEGEFSGASSTITRESNMYYSNDEGESWHILYTAKFGQSYWNQIFFVGEHNGKIYFTQHTGAGKWSFVAEIVDAEAVPVEFVEPYIIAENGKLVIGGAINHQSTKLYYRATEIAEQVGAGSITLVRAGDGIIFTSPDGTRYKATMANGGTWAITAV